MKILLGILIGLAATVPADDTMLEPHEVLERVSRTFQPHHTEETMAQEIFIRRMRLGSATSYSSMADAAKTARMAAQIYFRGN